MSSTSDHHALSKGREWLTLFALAAVQFTHIVDFMIMMPLGSRLMRNFQISPEQFTWLVAAYGIAAAVSGFVGGFIMDRVDRKHALLSLYAGFAISTFACGLAPSFHWLMAARIAAGAFGGLAGSMVTAMVGDIIPPARRGWGMSIVMGAFPVASALGVPIGIKLAGMYDWHAPFYGLGAYAAVNLIFAMSVIPHLKTAVKGHQPYKQMREIVSHPLHLRAFATATVLIMAGGVIVPFLAPSFVINVGLDEDTQLLDTYIVGGLVTAAITPLLAWMSDRVDRLRLLAVTSFLAIGVTLMITRLGPASVTVASLYMAAFMATMSSRFGPAMAMITNAVESRYRGGFMSVTAALQQAASGLASLIAGLFVTENAAGHLVGYSLLGYVATGFFLLTLLLAWQLRTAAPHVATPGARKTPGEPVHAEVAM